MNSPAQAATDISLISIDADAERCRARIRLVVPKFVKIASVREPEVAYASFLLNLHNTGWQLDEDLAELLDVGGRIYPPDGSVAGYLEHTADGWALWRNDETETVVGNVELWREPGSETLVYGTCGAPLDVWCSDAITQALDRSFGLSSDDAKTILNLIISHVDQAARGALGSVKAI